MQQPILLALFAVAGVIGTHQSAAKGRRAAQAAHALDAGFATIGGRAAYRALTGIRVTFAQSRYNVGQEEWLGAAPALATTLDGIEYRDYKRPGLLTKYRLANSPRTLTRLFLDDSAAFLVDTIVSGFGATTPSRGYAPMFRDDPIRILRGIASAPNDGVRELRPRTLLGRRVTGVEVGTKEDTVRLWLDATSNVPVAIERLEDDPISAQRTTLLALTRWISAGPVRVPGSIVVMENGKLSEAQFVSQAIANPSVDSAFASVPKKPSTPASSGLTVAELAPGIYRAEGAPGGVPYNVVFAASNDSVFVFDPPVSDSYATAVLDSVKARLPKARARMFVVSHHHSDHVSGARVAFAAGMTAIASEEIAEFVRGLGVTAGTKAPANRRVVAVRDTVAIGSGASRFVLYHVPTTHARGLVMAYFPEAKLLAEVDLAGGPLQDRRDLHDFVVRRGLVVEKLARMHGPVMPWTTFAQPFQK